MYFNKPYYVVDFDMSICNFEILINDVPAFKNMEGGSLASHYPINHFILKSGIQGISIRVFPLQGEATLRKDSYLKIKVHSFDSSTQDYNNLNEVYKYETPTYKDKDYPELLKIDKFSCDIPYSIEGWSSSTVIEDTFKQEILRFYKKIHNLASSNPDELFKLFQRKFLEVDKALYLNDNNKKEWKNLLKNLNNDHFKLQPFPSKYVTNIYGNKKVVEIVRVDKNSILNYRSNDGDEFNLPILIHKKDEMSDFEIIR